MMTSSLLIAAVLGESVEDIVRTARTGTKGADGVEIRLDRLGLVSREDLARLRADVEKPVIATCRWREQGGQFGGSEADRRAVLVRAAEAGFDYVDVEIEALAQPFPKRDSKLILSHHDFDGLPTNADELIAKALELEADVVKIAAHVRSLEEALTLSTWGETVRAAGKAYVPVAMGPAGVSARILAARMGAAWSYAAARGSAMTGPNQLSLNDMVARFRFASIGERTEILGIVGTHALATRSPSMHNPLFDRIGHDAVYVPFEETDLEAFVRGARRLGVSGLSVTLPFKRAILPLLDEVDEDAARIGAINTVVVRDGRWKGYNTDVDGVVGPLRRRGEWSGRRAVVVGAGGAARAAVTALERLGASVTVVARREERAAALAAEVGGTSGALSELETTVWDLLVNATPMGSAGESLPVGSIQREQTVFDMVTAPERTPLIRRAESAGAVTITGLHMLAAQAVRQAELWTGRTPDIDELEKDARGRVEPRYSRQVLFQEIGAEGQKNIAAARVLVVGVGALGSISSEMLVRAGVAVVRIADRDYVDESNLQRQSLFDEDDWRAGLPKAIAAERKLSRINGDVVIDAHVTDVHAGNVRSLFRDIDLVIDGTDNFETRYLLNDASIETGVPWIYAACVGSYGMSYVVLPGRTPCMRCFMEEEPAPGTSPTCDTAGVIAPAVHAVAAFQVAEALKILSGRDDALAGEILSLDVWHGRVDRFRPEHPRSECPACGRRELDYLRGDEGSQAVTLCGRDAVQVRPVRAQTIELESLARRLDRLGTVTSNPYLLRAKLDGVEIVVFKDGRAIVHGTQDPSEARSLYARYVGS